MPYLREGNCVYKKNADGSKGERVGCSDSEEMAEQHLKALYANVEEFSTSGGNDLILELGLPTEMKAGFPEVPFAPGLSFDDFVVEEITGYREEDGEQVPTVVKHKPTFVTMQIAEIGRKSEKGIVYDEELVVAIEEQINRKRPGGIFGHVDPSRPYDMPDPEVMWVGAKREGNVLWAKGWMRNPTSARRVTDIKRVGGTLGTSIWGLGKRVIENQAVRLKDFVLNRLDLADDVERSSLQLGGAFALTAELMDGEGEEIVDAKTVSEFLKTLKPAQVLELLADDQRSAVSEMIISTAETSATVKTVAELIGERDEARSQIAELTKLNEVQSGVIAKFETAKKDAEVREAIRRATPWNVTTDSGKALYQAMHDDLIYPAVVAELATGKEIGTAIAAVMEMKKVSIDSYRKAIAGNGLAAGSDNRIPLFGTERTDDQIADAQQRTNIRFQ